MLKIFGNSFTNFRTGYQQAILDNNLLEAVRLWLDPLPDKSLPSLNIQRALFPLLEKMYIDTTSLKMSGLGKLVRFYTECDRVDKSVARICDHLIGEWSNTCAVKVVKDEC